MPQTAVLLISDIVDSTRLAETLGDAVYGPMVDAHDDIVRGLADAHRGREINRSDGILMRFLSVPDAVDFAIAYHAELVRRAPELEVRIGIHVGSITVPDGVERRAAKSGLAAGVAVPMTARIAALASERQTLVSAAARAGLAGTTHRLVSHGHWRLKGIADPVEIFEVGDATTVFSPPGDAPKAYRVAQRKGLWLPRREIPHSLPAERDRFIGRDEDLNDIAEALDGDARCITIIGPGGVGKTRLAQRFGWRWLGDFDGGVWYCDLAQATTCDGLVSAVAQGLGLQLGASSPIAQIALAMQGRGRCLVILDNFEQLTKFATDTLGSWLDAAANTRFVVTSRTVLGVPGERVHRLSSMEPSESAELFADRAREASATFAPASQDRASSVARRQWKQDAETVAALVLLLDGIPLAIELAAARLRIMDLQTLLERMRERFKLLARGGGRVARHATLRATLDWSWDLLSAYEKSALGQASVFEGGFDLAAFESVVTFAESADAPLPMDMLQSLVEKSLIQQSSGRRFAYLLSVQEYAAERLEANADGGADTSPAATQHRHVRHYAMLDEAAATADRCVEIDNLVAAVRRAIALDDAEMASRALVNCWAALKQCGPYRTAEALAADVGRMAELSKTAEARVAFVAGSALQDMGDTAAAEHRFQRGLEAARLGGADYEQARILRAQGELELGAGRDAAAATTLAAALAAAEAIRDELLQCVALNALGTLAQSLGDNRTALERYGAALTLAERVGDQRWAGALLGNMGIAHYGLDDREAAKSHYLRSVVIAERFGDLRWIGNTRSNLGLVMTDQGLHDEALVELHAALKIARQLGHLRLECFVLWNLGITRAAQGLAAEASEHYRDARALAARLDDQRAMALLGDEIEAMNRAPVSG